MVSLPPAYRLGAVLAGHPAVLAGHPVVLAGHPVSSVDRTWHQRKQGQKERGMVANVGYGVENKSSYSPRFPVFNVQPESQASRITTLVTVGQTSKSKKKRVLCHIS